VTELFLAMMVGKNVLPYVQVVAGVVSVCVGLLWIGHEVIS
jgi:hypothetical protein